MVTIDFRSLFNLGGLGFRLSLVLLLDNLVGIARGLFNLSRSR